MGGGGKTPKPPKIETPPPPVQDVSGAYVQPTMQQEMARRQARGAFATRGQTLGASGEVLGASPIELANVREIAGVTQEKELSKAEFLKENPLSGKPIVVKGRVITGGRKAEEEAYQRYLKKLRKEQASAKGATKGQTI
jgi:hypothetical protein